jgi:hypothetical protein
MSPQAERRGKNWALLGIIKPEHKAAGTITPVGESP